MLIKNPLLFIMKNILYAIAGAAGMALVWWLTGNKKSHQITNTNNTPESQPRTAGVIGSIKLDQWVLELEYLDQDDLDLLKTSIGDFYITDHYGRRIKEITNGITTKLCGVEELVVPIKNLRDLRSAESGTACCKYSRALSYSLKEGVVKIEKGA